MSASDAITIDAPRFWATVMRSGEIGPGKAGGLRRLALTDADKEMRDLFVTWCTEAGCTISVDRVGNIFARRPGREDHLPPVLMGSHLDTQVAAGKDDGIVGVLAGLQVLRPLDGHGETADAGPTPMDRRRNALVGAAMLAVAVNEVGWKYHATEGKATVARMVAWPNKAGILSEYAQLTCDVRHAEREVADRMWADVKAAMPECARRANVEMRIAGEWQFGSERFDPSCIRLIREAAEQLNAPHRDILSQAGHDAYYASRTRPTPMTLYACRDRDLHDY